LPSEYEGFGTALWEARSCDAHLITTDAAPMNEGEALAYVRVHALTTIRRGCLVSGHRVKPTAVWNAMLTSTFGSRSSRQAWLTNEERFTARILEVFNNLIQRPKRRKISGGRNFIVAVMATIPGREKECRLARESLERQGIKVHVWDKEVQGRTDDARKFIFPRAGYRGFVLTVDDDLIYPPTYARDMVDAVEQYGCAVSLHGKSFKPPINSYYKDASLKVRCLGDLEDDVEVQIPGTGAMAWHTDFIQFAIEDFPNKNMADIHAGIKCHREGVRVMALAHTSDYFKYQRVPDTIWDRAHDDDAVQTALINDHHWE